MIWETRTPGVERGQAHQAGDPGAEAHSFGSKTIPWARGGGGGSQFGLESRTLFGGISGWVNCSVWATLAELQGSVPGAVGNRLLGIHARIRAGGQAQVQVPAATLPAAEPRRELTGLGFAEGGFCGSGLLVVLVLCLNNVEVISKKQKHKKQSCALFWPTLFFQAGVGHFSTQGRGGAKPED